MKNISLREIVTGQKDFIGNEWNGYTKEEKWKWINSYKKVEKETNDAILKHGSVSTWYESGEGRLI